jgi:AraC-like DNA-binding protein
MFAVRMKVEFDKKENIKFPNIITLSLTFAIFCTDLIDVVEQRKINIKQTNRMTTEQYPKVYLYKRIVQAKLFIDNNYFAKIDLDNISDEAFFSKFHFIRLFKSVYGKTPHQYLISVRIERALQLLQSNKKVTEVCFLVGFDSLTTFSGLFKRIVGVPPTIYLTDHQNRRAEILKTPLAFIPGCYALQHGWIKNSNFEEVN